jgi:hypothetical protein
MGLVGAETRVRPPDDEGAEIVIRMLSFKELKAARDARQSEVFKLAREAGGEIIEAIETVRSKTDGAAKPKRLTDEQRETEALNEHDLETLLRAGIVSWSYAPEVDVAKLDQETAQWTGKAILRLSRAIPERDDDRKNAS